MRIRLIASDLDGTIVDEHGETRPSVGTAVDRARAMGVKFAICSGRPVDSILPLLKRWGLEGRCDYIIGSNGGEVKDVARDKTVLSYTLSPQVLRDIMDLYEPLGLIPTLYDGTRLYVQRITAQAEKVAARLFVEPVKGDIRALSVHPEVKEMMVLDPALMTAAEAFAAAHPDPRYVSFKTAADLYEFNHPLLAKDVGVRIVASMLQAEPEEILAFGDTTNDLEMLQYAGHGVCMASGTKDALAAADDTAGSPAQDGFADYLQKHLIRGCYVG